MVRTDVEIKSQVTQAGRVVLLAVALGVTADLLVLRQGLTGAGFFVWMICLIAAAVYLSETSCRHRVLSLIPSVWALLALMAAFLLMFRSTPVVLPLMLLVLLSCAVNWLLQQRGNRFSDTTVLDYPLTAIRIPMMLLKGLLATSSSVDPAMLPRQSIRGVIKGVLLALPLVMVFAMLFASADARFGSYMSSLTRVFSFTAMEHMLSICFLSVLALALLAQKVHRPAASRITLPDRLTLGREETLVIMGSLSVLFLIFVILQAGYLFGGRELIQQTSGLSLAEYARRGFFEMVVVAALTLMVLLIMSALHSDQRIFGPLAVLMVCLVMIIMLSALQRLMLYVNEFGLSVARLLALGVMIWLAGCLAAFVMTILRGKPQGFAFGAAVSATCLLLMAVWLNPAAVVAETNIKRVLADAGRSVDVSYLHRLGGDAVPVMLKYIDDLPLWEQCQMAVALTQRWSTSLPQQNWSHWNASRAAAQRAVERDYEKLSIIIQQADNEPLSKLPDWHIRGICTPDPVLRI
jgi:hypothetical protein